MCSLLKWVSLLLSCICLITLTYGQTARLSCGRRITKRWKRVMAGEESNAGDWPWHVAIFLMDNYSCGGSIIDENTILTTAHCVSTEKGLISKSQVSVHIGNIHLDTTEYTQDVKKIIVHPQFNGTSIAHDIALIKLSSDITMNQYVQPVCLWTMDSTQEQIMGTYGTAIGFGYDEHDRVTPHLKQANIIVIKYLTCIMMDRYLFGLHLTYDTFCGIGQHRSACNGDSGGGMFFKIGGNWFVRGIVSYSPARRNTNLCDPLMPTVYTDVAKYVDWIKLYINPLVLPPEENLYVIDYEEKLHLFNFHTCGLRSSTYYNKGTLWTTPWLGFVKQENVFSEYLCAVTLINEWYAVGSASCFDMITDDMRIFISLGGASDKVTCDTLTGIRLCSHPTQKRYIQNVTKHPEFNRNTYAHDIALIELQTPADTSQPNVKPLCFPVTPELRTNALNNLHVPINRKTSFENIPVHYVKFDECMRRNLQDNITTNQEKNRLCAEKANHKEAYTCGRSLPGSPLQEMRLFNETERYFLRGLDLLGLTCNGQLPTVYLNAEPYLDWILFNMRSKIPSATSDSENSTTTQTLESEWDTLLQQPGKEKLHLFNMHTCGVNPVLQHGVDHMPWLGLLINRKEQNGKYVFSDRNSDQAVLISEWYALTASRMDKLWDYIFLGKNNKQGNDEIMYQVVKIKNITIPSPVHLGQTFALIELLEPADLGNPYIKPICLPFMNRLHQLNSTQVVVTTNIIDEYFFYKHKLTVIDRASCQDRLLFNGVSLVKENSTCAIRPSKWGDQTLIIKRGSPFLLHVQFGKQSRYFLYGMDVYGYDKFHIQPYGVYLFEKINSADLEWVVNNMQEKQRQLSIPTSEENEPENLVPDNVSSFKEALSNIHNGGEASCNNATSWIGRISTCLVTLIVRCWLSKLFQW